jgi:hypothetical protein
VFAGEDVPLAAAAFVVIAELLYLTTPNLFWKNNKTICKGTIMQLEELHETYE